VCFLLDDTIVDLLFIFFEGLAPHFSVCSCHMYGSTCIIAYSFLRCAFWWTMALLSYSPKDSHLISSCVLMSVVVYMACHVCIGTSLCLDGNVCASLTMIEQGTQCGTICSTSSEEDERVQIFRRTRRLCIDEDSPRC